jgi:hypothetical protein
MDEMDDFEYGTDPYDSIPFGDAQRFEDEQVARDLDAGEGRPDYDDSDDIQVGDRLKVTRHDDRPHSVGTVRYITGVDGTTVHYRELGGVEGTTGRMTWPEILQVASFEWLKPETGFYRPETK